MNNGYKLLFELDSHGYNKKLNEETSHLKNNLMDFEDAFLGQFSSVAFFKAQDVSLNSFP
jgi:hypothetical protein